MEDTRYGLKVSVPVPYDEAIVRATDALKAQGFGVLTTIDVKQTLKAKLDRDFRKYVILGACNPAAGGSRAARRTGSRAASAVQRDRLRDEPLIERRCSDGPACRARRRR